jgi:hypothetical protein
VLHRHHTVLSDQEDLSSCVTVLRKLVFLCTTIVSSVEQNLQIIVIIGNFMNTMYLFFMPYSKSVQRKWNVSCILDSPYFQEMTVGKTPVSVLQELLSRRGTTPKYELVQIEGAIHEPTFRYRVTVADVVGMYGSQSNVP